MSSRIIFGLTYRQYFRLLRQCYRHGFYCKYEAVNPISNIRSIYLQKCNYVICLYITDSFSDIWDVKHTWTNYLESRGII